MAVLDPGSGLDRRRSGNRPVPVLARCPALGARGRRNHTRLGRHRGAPSDCRRRRRLRDTRSSPRAGFSTRSAPSSTPCGGPTHFRPFSATTSSSTCSPSPRRRASSRRSRCWSPESREAARPVPGRLAQFDYGLIRTTAPPPGPKTVPVVTESVPLWPTATPPGARQRSRGQLRLRAAVDGPERADGRCAEDLHAEQDRLSRSRGRTSSRRARRPDRSRT